MIRAVNAEDAGGRRVFRVLISVDQKKEYTKEASPKGQAGNIMKL